MDEHPSHNVILGAVTVASSRRAPDAISRRQRLQGLLGPILLGVLMTPAAARAQDVDPENAAAAQALFEQASMEMDKRQYASACPKLEEVARLVPSGLGAKLALGECYEAQGKLASAWSRYALVQSLATAAGQPQRSREAAEKAAALRPKLATLTVQVPDNVRGVAGITVTRDGVLLGGAQFGAALPVDAGAHEIVVSAPDYLPWRKRVEVLVDGANVTLEVGMPVPGRAPSRPVPPPRSWQRPLGLGFMGLGLAGAGVGAVFGAMALNKNDDSNADNHCNTNGFCDAAGAASRNKAVAFGNTSTAAFIAGGTLLAGGVLIFVLTPSASHEKTEIQAAISPGELTLRGTF